jgi:catechol 2,3-dioxygenase-like lactoylglutathione lyase family enzyme
MPEPSTPNRPGRTAGLRHVALKVRRLEACEHFYVDLLGMAIEWRPDADNVYLSSGNDNLALHRITAGGVEAGPGDGRQYGLTGERLDHIGFIIDKMDAVDEWYRFLVAEGVEVAAPPKTHRDGARSFYIKDPDGNIVQLIYHPPISGQVFR